MDLKQVIIAEPTLDGQVKLMKVVKLNSSGQIEVWESQVFATIDRYSPNVTDWDNKQVYKVEEFSHKHLLPTDF